MPESKISDEWRQHFMLPVAAALGGSYGVLHIYGLGPFIKPIGDTFGWSRTMTTAGLSLALVIQALAGVPIGMLVDRIGSRRLALLGIPLTACGFSLLGTATGSAGNWYLLWAIMACAVLPIQPMVWSSAVATRFVASRGLAFGVTLSGPYIGIALFPYVATWLIVEIGWRAAFAVLAAIWLLVVYPLILFFFRGANDDRVGRGSDRPKRIATSGGVGFAESLRSTVYLRLLLTSFLFSMTSIALVVHFVPLLTSGGLAPGVAAGTASLLGFASIAGGLGAGALLDRFRASTLGAIAFLLPAVGCFLLLTAGHLTVAAMAAAVLIGLVSGVELDIIFYLTSRFFGLERFGTLSGGNIAAMTIGAAVGPLAAAKAFDLTGSYDFVLWASIAGMLVSSIALATLPRPTGEFAGH